MMEIRESYDVKVRTYHKNGSYNYEAMFGKLEEADGFYNSFVNSHPDCPKPTVWVKYNDADNIWNRVEGY